MVRIASGSELKKVRIFITSDGRITTPQEGLRKRPNVVPSGDHTETKQEETGTVKETNS